VTYIGFINTQCRIPPTEELSHSPEIEIYDGYVAAAFPKQWGYKNVRL